MQECLHPVKQLKLVSCNFTYNFKKSTAGISQNSFGFHTLVCSGDNTESTTTGSTTVTVSPTTASTGNRQQGDNTILIGEVLLN